MKVWAQQISIALSGVSLFLALCPRTYDDRSAGQKPFRLHTWPKLLRFPVFWIGILFFLYIVVGALNPAWDYQTDGTSWWMMKIDHVLWLPAGVRVPFSMWGPWRMLMIYGSAWMTICAVWTGFTRRRSFQSAFIVLSVNAFVLACLGLAQRGTGASKIFWLWTPPESYFVSSFIYKNHAGAYFCILLSLTIGMAFWLHERGVNRLDKSSPAGLFAFFAAAVAMIVFYSYSRTATLLMAVFILFAFALLLWHAAFRPSGGTGSRVMVSILAITLIAFVGIGITSLKTEYFVQQIIDLQRVIDQERPEARPQAALATWEMAKDRPYTGWGIGSFRFMFPAYQARHPQIFTAHGRRLFFEHAHNDYLELLAELGIAGLAILIAGGAYVGIRLTALSFWCHALPLCVVIGCVLTLVHSIVDFNFYNPAVLTTWFVLILGMIRWLEMGQTTSERDLDTKISRKNSQ